MKFATLWATVKRSLTYQDDVMLEHLPVQAEKNYAKKLAKARERHGKEFHTHERKPRETLASRDLVAIEDAVSLQQAKRAGKPEATVTKIKATK